MTSQRQKDLFIKFDIPSCTLSGCMHNDPLKNTCWFHDRSLLRWISFVTDSDIHPTCKLAEQVRIYKTKELLK